MDAQLHLPDTALTVQQCPNFNALSVVSFCAAVCSLTYSTIAIGGSIKAGRQPDAEYNLNGYSTAGGLFGVFNALGVVAFACGSLAHSLALALRSGMAEVEQD